MKEKDDKILLAQVSDKIEMCENKNKIEYTDFLDLAQIELVQNYIDKLKIENYMSYGGFEQAERKMFVIYPEKFNSTVVEKNLASIVKIVRIQLPDELKGKYTHRDYLGALLNLGVDRSVVGDILIKDKEAWFFCLHKMSDFFIENLIRVKHTTVLVSRVKQAEEIPEPEFEMTNGTCASVRLDALIGLAFQTSRSSMVSFIESGLVFVNGKLITSNGYEPKEGDIISVRGKGRFIYDGVSRQTKKGRLGVRIRKYV